MPTYAVVVYETLTRRYVVQAEDEDRAREIVEEDDGQLVGSLSDSSWSVEFVDELDPSTLLELR